jgi:hypothetical protein
VATSSQSPQIAACPDGFTPVAANNFAWSPGEQYRCWNGSPRGAKAIASSALVTPLSAAG